MKKMIFASLLAVAMLGFAQENQPPKPEQNGGAPKETQGRVKRQRPPVQGGRNLLNELKDFQTKFMAKFDKDQDGKLSEAERAAIDEELNLEKATEKVRMARAWDMFKKLDKDNDGILSDEELAGIRNMRPAGGRQAPKGDRPQRRKPEEKKAE